MIFRLTLFAIISGIFIPLNSTNASSDDKYRYFFLTGSATAICQSYSINIMSEKDASMMLNSIIEIGNKDLKESKNALNKFIKNGDNFKKYGCSKLVK